MPEHDYADDACRCAGCVPRVASSTSHRDRSDHDIAMRNPRGGKAHLVLNIDAKAVTRAERTPDLRAVCGKPTASLISPIRINQLERDDLCPQCFPPGQETFYPTFVCTKCGFDVSGRPDKAEIREQRGDGGYDHRDGRCAELPVKDKAQRRHYLARADRAHRNAVLAARRRGDVL